MTDYDMNDDPSSQLLNDLHHAASGSEPDMNNMAQDHVHGTVELLIPDSRKLSPWNAAMEPQSMNMHGNAFENEMDGVFESVEMSREGNTSETNYEPDETMLDMTYEHTNGHRCSCSPGASTPPASEQADDSSSASASEDGQSSDVDGGIDDESVASQDDLHDSGMDDNDTDDQSLPIRSALPLNEINKAQKTDKALHMKAKALIPHKIAPQRYWIAVLNHDLEPRDARKEKDFLWIKGHRLNTVETIWHQYQNATAEDTFRLEVHNEKVEPEDVMEELDYYDDKLVVFRAMLPNRFKNKGFKDAPICLD